MDTFVSHSDRGAYRYHMMSDDELISSHAKQLTHTNTPNQHTRICIIIYVSVCLTWIGVDVKRPICVMCCFMDKTQQQQLHTSSSKSN